MNFCTYCGEHIVRSHADDAWQAVTIAIGATNRFECPGRDGHHTEFEVKYMAEQDAERDFQRRINAMVVR